MITDAKRAAGRAAAEFAEDGMVLGLGSGTTILFTLERLGERIRKEGLSLRGIPTSKATEEAARKAGIPLVGLEEVERVDLCIDGADEVDPALNLIKGGGGALLREKIVMASSAHSVIVVDGRKLVGRLGEKFLLPLEVLPFGWNFTARAVKALGGEAMLRKNEEGGFFRTDNGNFILDCRFPGIPDPASLEGSLNRIPGVLENGLFVGLAGLVLVGMEDGSVEERRRPGVSLPPEGSGRPPSRPG